MSFPVLPKDFSESLLEMPRVKRRSLLISAAFRLKTITRAVFGPRLILALCLDGAWLLWRLAFELSSEVFGPEFQTSARNISEDLLARHIPKGGSVLDVGCGAGRWSRIAARHAGRVLGIDRSEAEIEKARLNTSEENIEYVAGDAIAAIGERHFDAAMLIHVLEHIDEADEFLQFMREAADVLIVEVPNFDADPLNAVRHAMGRPFHTDADHVREYTAPILRDLLTRNGLQILSFEERRGSLVAVARKS